MVRITVVSILFVAAALAQTPKRFEVASIRPAEEQAGQVDVGIQISGAQLRISSMTIKDYVAAAFGVRPNQIVGPDWITQARFAVAASIPAGSPSDDLDEMLQTLLADRFALKSHRESREFPVYALVADRGGARVTALPPDPATEAGRREPVNLRASGSAAGVTIDFGGGASFSLANNKIEVKKLSMADLADMLTRFMDRPVVDMTMLGARYDLTLDLVPDDFTPMLIRSAINQGLSLPAPALRLLDTASSDPLSGPLQKYGLTLDSRRAPLEVLVIDSVLKAPTEN